MKINELLNQNPHISATFKSKPLHIRYLQPSSHSRYFKKQKSIPTGFVNYKKASHYYYHFKKEEKK